MDVLQARIQPDLVFFVVVDVLLLFLMDGYPVISTLPTSCKSIHRISAVLHFVFLVVTYKGAENPIHSLKLKILYPSVYGYTISL